MSLLCPFCEIELTDAMRNGNGWDCPCGEFIPDGSACDNEKSKGCGHHDFGKQGRGA